MEVLADELWRVADGGTAEALSMWGALTLQRAITAAHLADATAAYGFLDRARPAAERAGPCAQPGASTWRACPPNGGPGC